MRCRIYNFIWSRVCNYELASKINYDNNMTFATKYQLHKLHFQLMYSALCTISKNLVTIWGKISRCFFRTHVNCFKRFSNYFKNPLSVVLLFTLFKPFCYQFWFLPALLLLLLLPITNFPALLEQKLQKQQKITGLSNTLPL